MCVHSHMGCHSYPLALGHKLVLFLKYLIKNGYLPYGRTEKKGITLNLKENLHFLFKDS